MPKPQGTDEAIEAILAPLRKRDAELEAEQAEIKAELAEVTRERSKLGGILRAAEKSLGLAEPPKAKRAGGGKSGKPAPERLDGLETWLRVHLDGNEFTGPELLERKDFRPLDMSSAYLSSALNLLHERGALRLVRTGGEGLAPRTKTWQVAGRG